jgi:hypothetical protein
MHYKRPGRRPFVAQFGLGEEPAPAGVIGRAAASHEKPAGRFVARCRQSINAGVRCPPKVAAWPELRPTGGARVRATRVGQFSGATLHFRHSALALTLVGRNYFSQSIIGQLLLLLLSLLFGQLAHRCKQQC